jgi:glycosyltransferase involved in cell wall biosynthesis
VHYIKNETNLGLPKSCNLGIEKSLGRYIVRVDADDYIANTMLFFQKTFLDKNRKYQAVACDYVVIDENENTIFSQTWKEKEIACGIMYRKEPMLDTGLYNESFKMREGHELNNRFKKKYNIYNLEISLYKYRIHGKNRTKIKKQLKKIHDDKLKILSGTDFDHE